VGGYVKANEGKLHWLIQVCDKRKKLLGSKGEEEKEREELLVIPEKEFSLGKKREKRSRGEDEPF